MRLIKSDLPLTPPDGMDPRDRYLGQIISSLYDVRNRVHLLERRNFILMILIALLGIGDLVRMLQWMVAR